MPNAILRTKWIVALVGLIACPVAAHSQEAEDPGRLAQEATRRLAAVRALQRRVLDDKNYQVPVEEIVRLIFANLDAHIQPAPEKLGPKLRDRCQLLVDNGIAAIAKELDPNGQLKVGEFLADYVNKTMPGQNRSVRQLADEKMREFILNRYPTVYQEARKVVTNEQRRQIDKRLASELDKLAPSAQEIDESLKGADARSALVKRVSNRLANDAILLQETREQVQVLAEELCRDGEEQFRRQATFVQTAPVTSRTPIGLKRELMEKTIAMISEAKPRPGRKNYGVFPAVERLIGELARVRFGEQIAATAQELPLEPPDELLKEAAAAIEAQPRAHHRLRDSETIFADRAIQSLTDRVVKQARVRAAENASRWDGKIDMGQFEAQTRERLQNPDSSWQQTWRQLRDKALTSLRHELVRIRAKAKASQTLRYAAPLIKEPPTWVPTEKELRDLDVDRLGREELKTLSVWSTPPPQSDEELLEETWIFLIEKAAAAIRMGKAALHAQDKLVDDHKEEITERVKGEPSRGEGLWTQFWIDELKLRWANTGGQSARLFPELFSGPQQKIRGIIAAAIRDEALELQRGLVRRLEPEIARMISQDKDPQRTKYVAIYEELVLQAWKAEKLSAEEPQLHSYVKDDMGGIVARLVNAERDAREKTDRQAREEAERRAREEAGRRAQEEAERRAQEAKRTQIEQGSDVKSAEKEAPPPEKKDNDHAKGAAEQEQQAASTTEESHEEPKTCPACGRALHDSGENADKVALSDALGLVRAAPGDTGAGGIDPGLGTGGESGGIGSDGGPETGTGASNQNGQENGKGGNAEKVIERVIPWWMLLLMGLLVAASIAWNIKYLREYRRNQQLVKLFGPDPYPRLKALASILQTLGDDADAHLAQFAMALNNRQ